MLTFRITAVQHGWADVLLSDENGGVSLTASYISDALGDLVRATLTVIHVGAAECSWLIEPGEYRWLLRRTPEHLQGTIVQFANWHPRKSEADGRVVFLFECSLERWIRQILAEFQSLLDQYGDAGYQERWSTQFSFPAAELQELRHRLRSTGVRGK